MIANACPEVERFLTIVDNSPENDSVWMEQLRINELAASGEFAALLQEIDIRYNSVPGFAASDSPVVVAAHGLPMEARLQILGDCLARPPTTNVRKRTE